MGKKIAVGIGIIALVCFCVHATLRAQRPVEPAGGDELAKMEAKLDQVLANTSEADKKILVQLAVVVSNQEKILKELEIVKVRATRR
ncbi:MAG: hypothetical protein WDL87_07190 [Candidatus Omnitrophota bacterium]|jgi:hypothetical protein